jgi:hypothetical protein
MNFIIFEIDNENQKLIKTKNIIDVELRTSCLENEKHYIILIKFYDEYTQSNNFISAKFNTLNNAKAEMKKIYSLIK